MKLSSRWMKYARKPEEKKEVQAKLLAAKPALDLLRRIVEEEMISKGKAIKSKENYELAGWPFLQADAIGEERAYLSVLKLLTITYEE
jgi:hypothetical protein